jgi:hypothetical protein
LPIVAYGLACVPLFESLPPEDGGATHLSVAAYAFGGDKLNRLKIIIKQKNKVKIVPLRDFSLSGLLITILFTPSTFFNRRSLALQLSGYPAADCDSDDLQNIT